jgi:hypothetical protein
MQRARKTPETMLCHFDLVLENWIQQQRPEGVIIDAVPDAEFIRTLTIGNFGQTAIAFFALHKCNLPVFKSIT